MPHCNLPCFQGSGFLHHLPSNHRSIRKFWLTFLTTRNELIEIVLSYMAPSRFRLNSILTSQAFAKHSFASVLHLRLASVMKYTFKPLFFDPIRLQLAFAVHLYVSTNLAEINCILMCYKFRTRTRSQMILAVVSTRRCKIWVAPGPVLIFCFIFCKKSKFELFLFFTVPISFKFTVVNLVIPVLDFTRNFLRNWRKTWKNWEIFFRKWVFVFIIFLLFEVNLKFLWFSTSCLVPILC